MKSKRCFQTAKKGMGLTDLFSILLFALIIVIFYFLIKISIGSFKYDINGASTKVQEKVDLINFLRTPLNIDGAETDIAQVIALSRIDPSKKEWLKNNVSKYIADSISFSFSNYCSMLCISREKYKGDYDEWDIYSDSKDCASAPCPSQFAVIPSYNGLIEVRLGTSEKPEQDYAPIN